MTRIPTQKRALEKRDKIIEKGFELICDKGYYNVNTSDIAKYADVSVGIIYQYFNDKKEIFLEGVKNYSRSIMYPMVTVVKDINIDNIEDIINKLIDEFVKSHTISKKAHEELIAMSHLDEDIADIFSKEEINITNEIINILNINNIKLDNAFEKVHIIIGIVDNLCHEAVYHKHDEVNYEIMKKEVVKIILGIIK